MPKPEPSPFTDFAMATLSLGVAFSEAFNDPITDEFPYKLQLVTPEGTSTEGGKRAAARIELVHTSGATALVGAADVHARKAALVPFAKLAWAAGTADDAGAKLPSREQYEALSERLAGFLAHRRLAVEREGATATPAAKATPPDARGRAKLVATFLLVVAIGAIVAFFGPRCL
jgi:hypothetical protein